MRSCQSAGSGFFILSGGLAAPLALEALDTRARRDRALHARIGRMAGRADVEPELRLRRADVVARPARGADRGRTHELGMDCRLHESPSFRRGTRFPCAARYGASVGVARRPARLSCAYLRVQPVKR